MKSASWNFLLAGHNQVIVPRLDLQIVLGKASHCHGNPVVVVVELLDVAGREAQGSLIDARAGLQKVHQTIEAERRTEQGRKVKTATHDTLH